MRSTVWGHWRGDVVKVDCTACHHVALLTPEALLKLGLSDAVGCGCVNLLVMIALLTI
jgi:hypothetical protein